MWEILTVCSCGCEKKQQLINTLVPITSSSVLPPHTHSPVLLAADSQSLSDERVPVLPTPGRHCTGQRDPGSYGGCLRTALDPGDRQWHYVITTILYTICSFMFKNTVMELYLIYGRLGLILELNKVMV